MRRGTEDLQNLSTWKEGVAVISDSDALELVRAKFAIHGIAVQAELRSYPGESIIVVSVGPKQSDLAIRIAKDLEADLVSQSFAGFLTVRQVDEGKRASRSETRVALTDPRTNAFRDLLSQRSRTSQIQGSLHYVVDANQNLAAVLAPRHHLIFGRRGVGKTALLVEAEKALLNRGARTLWINAQTYHNLPWESTLAFIALDIATLIERDWVESGKLSPYRDEAAALRKDLTEVTRGGPSPGIELVVPRIQRLLSRSLALQGKRLYIFIDDFHHIEKALQPKLLDAIHGCVRDADAWLKIAAIRHLANWWNPPLGLETGQDADHIELDVTLQEPARAKEFLEKILRSYAEFAGIGKPTHVFSPLALDRLVIASGSVPRDYLVLAASAIRIAQGHEDLGVVGAEEINRAAGDSATVKLNEVEEDVASQRGGRQRVLDALATVRKNCLEANRFTIFRIDYLDKEQNPEQYESIANLMDLRLIHLVHGSISHEREAGRRFEVYMLDISQYTSDRVKKNIKVLELEEGVLVLRETGKNSSIIKRGVGSLGLVGLLRKAPVFNLSDLKTIKEAT